MSEWFKVGHVTHVDERTGCTVILFDRLSPAWVDVRGGAPGTRETDLLAPGRLVAAVDAILLTGGSAFGLAAADGVMTWLAEQGRGVPTAAGPVPIVPGAVIFDLAVGEPCRVTAEDGYVAASNASPDLHDSGLVGAGTGATVAKIGGGPATPGGLGIASVTTGSVTVTAFVVLNALGDVRDPETGQWLARGQDAEGHPREGRDFAMHGAEAPPVGENTTIGAVLISGDVNHTTLVRSGISAHDALARCVVPAHTMFDGDTLFVVASGSGEVDPAGIMAISCATEVAVENAIRGLFTPSRTATTA
jgi:L-aminopeptidase/D-esterase-like protein